MAQDKDLLPVGEGLKIPATGQAAEIVGHFAKTGSMQPVEWKLPEGAVAEVAQDGAFVSDEKAVNLFALEVGKVYRFRICNIPGRPNDAVYPTVELLGKLNPPVGRAWDFPVELALPASDIEAALNGALVTRVVFLENSENAANVDAGDNPENLTLDVPRGVDPLLAARTRGRALALVRLGSRAPVGEPNAEDPFFFGLPKVEFKPIVNAEKEPAADMTPEDAKAVSDPVNVL